MRLEIAPHGRAAACAAVLVFTPDVAVHAREIFVLREGAPEPALLAERVLPVNDAAAGGIAAVRTI